MRPYGVEDVVRAPRGSGGAGAVALSFGIVLGVDHRVAIPVPNTSVPRARNIGPALSAGWAAIGRLALFIVAPLQGGVAVPGLRATMGVLDPTRPMPERLWTGSRSRFAER